MPETAQAPTARTPIKNVSPAHLTYLGHQYRYPGQPNRVTLLWSEVRTANGGEGRGEGRILENTLEEAALAKFCIGNVSRSTVVTYGGATAPLVDPKKMKLIGYVATTSELQFIWAERNGAKRILMTSTPKTDTAAFCLGEGDAYQFIPPKGMAA